MHPDQCNSATYRHASASTSKTLVLGKVTMSSHEELIARYEKGINLFEEALRGAPPEMLDLEPAPGKWTIRQLAAHLADAELVLGTRMRWIAAEPGSPLAAFDQDKWAASLNYGQQSPQQALQMFSALRRSTAALLRSLPESAWERIGKHQERGPMSLKQMVESSCEHAEHHSGHMRDLRRKFSAAA
jgi:uncharacterized damage-inducible protein DinB